MMTAKVNTDMTIQSFSLTCMLYSTLDNTKQIMHTGMNNIIN